MGRVCQAFVQLCRSQELFGGELVAVDGSKFHADNSPAKVTRQTDLMARLEQVAQQIDAWLSALARADAEECPTVTDEAGNTRTALAVLNSGREAALFVYHQGLSDLCAEVPVHHGPATLGESPL